MNYFFRRIATLHIHVEREQ